MPVWISSFLIGFGVGYYALNDTVRHLVNQILLTLLKIAHRLTVFLLAGILKGLNWCYSPRQTEKIPFKVKSYSPTPQPAQKQGVGVKDVVLADGKRGLLVSDEELARWMKNPDIKISERKEEK